MSLLADIRILYHLMRGSSGGKSHAERLENFYGGQAQDYDSFRKRLLQGREEMISRLEVPEGGVWIDMGGGTGSNLESMGTSNLNKLKKAYVVDLCPSLLKVADERIRCNGWTNVETVQADVNTYSPPEGQADIVTFSYSLTMIPNWFIAIDHAKEILKDSGQIGVVDFYVARKFPEENQTKHPWHTRSFWPVWFAADNVFPCSDHLPYLQHRFEPRFLGEYRARVPYMPIARVPYYIFMGTSG